MNKFGTCPQYALLSVDPMNAFNMCSRAAFFKAVQKFSPQLLPWILYCYNTSPAFFWTGFEIIWSVKVPQQGDPLSGLLFPLVFHHTALKMKELLPAPGEEDTGYGCIAFLVVAPCRRLHCSQTQGLTQGRAKFPLHLAVSKCKVWWLTSRSASVQATYSLI